MTVTKPKNIALLGGTGRVGGWVLESCLEEGCNVRALCRNASKVSHLIEKHGKANADDGGKLVVVEGDAMNEASIQELLKVHDHDNGNSVVDVIISTLGSPSNATLIVEKSAKVLVSVLTEIYNEKMKKANDSQSDTNSLTMPRIIWMTSTGINEATDQAKMYPLWGKPSKWFFGYGFFGWLQFKILIPYIIGQDLWDDMGKSELVFRGESPSNSNGGDSSPPLPDVIKNHTVLVRPTNMHPVSELETFSDGWRKEGGTNTQYQLVKATDPPSGKWITRRAISTAILDLVMDETLDGTAVSVFQQGKVE